MRGVGCRVKGVGKTEMERTGTPKRAPPNRLKRGEPEVHARGAGVEFMHKCNSRVGQDIEECRGGPFLNPEH